MLQFRAIDEAVIELRLRDVCGVASPQLPAETSKADEGAFRTGYVRATRRAVAGALARTAVWLDQRAGERALGLSGGTIAKDL
jgi:hypothetical protein